MIAWAMLMPPGSGMHGEQVAVDLGQDALRSIAE